MPSGAPGSLEVKDERKSNGPLPSFLLFSGSCAGLSRLQDGLCATVSSFLRKLGSEEKENEETGQRQTVEAIDLDSRNGLLLLLLMQQLMIVWVTALELESLLNREKSSVLKLLVSPITINIQAFQPFLDLFNNDNMQNTFF